MGGVQNSSGNSGGVVGGYFSGQKLEILGRRGGAYVKYPPWWGYGYFLELHIWDFYGYSLNTLKYPKNGNLLFYPVTQINILPFPGLG